MSFFSKTPIQQIDYDINPSDWDATNTSTTAKLSLQRMKNKDGDKKRQQQIREKCWYVDIPYFLKGVVPDGETFKVADVEPEIKGRFYGKDPASAKTMFETYFANLKSEENKKLQQKLKEIKIKRTVQATETAQKIMEEGTPRPPSPDVTHVLSEGDNPIEYGNTNSPFAGLQVNSVNAPQQRVSKLSAAEIQARKNASKTRKLERRKPSPPKPINMSGNSTQSVQRQVISAERAQRQAERGAMNPAFLSTKLRTASESTTGSTPKGKPALSRKILTPIGTYIAPSLKSLKSQTRRRKPVVVNQNFATNTSKVANAILRDNQANANVNQQISTMFN